ncbi:MAG: lysophospholipid acyltransferase family protein [Gemmatimonadaceae bacterium]|nr:lysophospholipid acyltransferase family protein [Gemmatimonadaceae bacterium]
MPSLPIAPRLPATIPRRRSRTRRLIGTWGLRAFGWRIVGDVPDAPRLVLIVAPHTSNWDFVIGFLGYLALELDTTWFGKHTLFRWPLGPLFRHFGGIPIERGRSANVVDAYVEEFRRRDHMLLALAPEGTRRRVTEWKSGFYHIASGAGALILPVALDYSARLIRIFPSLRPGGDIARDMEHLRRHFTASMARDPSAYDDR